MATINQVVDDLVARGRIQADMKDQYVKLMAANPQLEQEFTAMFMRGSDYTQKTQRLAEEKRQAQAQLTQEWQKLQTERQQLQEWQGQVQGELGKLDVLPQMSAKIAAYEQALRDYQIYDKVTVPDVPTPNINPQPTPVEKMKQQDPDSPYMTMKDAGSALRDFAVLQGKISRIHARHMKLFGEPLDDDLVSHYLDTGEDPENHWRIKYGVDMKQQDMANQTRQAEIAKIREETRAEVLREMSLDPSRITGSPLGKQPGGLTPIFENYAQSRALAHGQNNPTGVTPPPTATDFVPPEKRPDLAASRDRIAAASRMFNEHFDINGNPTTDQGRKWSQTYKSD